MGFLEVGEEVLEFAIREVGGGFDGDVAGDGGEAREVVEEDGVLDGFLEGGGIEFGDEDGEAGTDGAFAGGVETAAEAEEDLLFRDVLLFIAPAAALPIPLS